MGSRRTRDLRWDRSADVARVEELVLSPFASPREQAAYLLHIGAEIEHALAVQYLYAGYSLSASHLTDPTQRKLVEKWRSTVLTVAREEMAHLATVQNVLTAIGSPLTFEREDFPIPAILYPFEFRLQRLTKESLAMYVLAEMPAPEALAQAHLTDEVDEIRARVPGGKDYAVHRVGYLYERVQNLFTPTSADPAPATMVASSDIQAESVRFQVREAEWGLGHTDLVIRTATDRQSAANAIHAIAEQGEGIGIPETDLGLLPANAPAVVSKSHFSRFLEIYREFPADSAWQPARNVATNPTTDPSAPPDRQITHPQASLWAQLFNLRYRMLLTFLLHSFGLQAPLDPSGRTPRGLVISWTFGEMYNLRCIADILMELPLNDRDDVRAGPPFDMPYSLAIPMRAHDWWRLHRDLLESSQKFVRALQTQAGAELESYLMALRGADARALHQIATIIGE